MEPRPGKYKPPPVKNDYPCWVTYAVMGPTEAGVLQAVKDVMGKHKHRVKQFKSTDAESGFSVHVETFVTSEYQRTEFFHKFQIHRQVRWIV